MHTLTYRFNFKKIGNLKIESKSLTNVKLRSLKVKEKYQDPHKNILDIH